MAAMAGQEWMWGPFSLGYVAHTMALHPGTGNKPLQLACGSFIPEASNFVDILSIDLAPTGTQVVRSTGRLPHYYPPTKVKWLDAGVADGSSSLLLTCGDVIRVWSSNGELRRLLRHDANPQGVCTPITSLDIKADAGTAGPGLVSCDVYGICALWDLERGVIQQALDLGQSLCDVAFGPDRLVVAAGEQGDCFLLDPRQPQDVDVLAPREHLRGPARLAWSSFRPSIFAAAWQAPQEGGIALYSTAGAQHKSSTQLLQKATPQAAVADLQWSPAFPEFLCCAKEDGAVEVWQIPKDFSDAAAPNAAARGPCFRWEPSRTDVCTALAASHEVSPGKHCLVLATMPGQQGAEAGGSLWIAGLPTGSKGTLQGDAPALHRGADASTDTLSAPAVPAAEPSSDVSCGGRRTASAAEGGLGLRLGFVH
eukprot:gnl/TRDRNA2_/TRDRNA2_190147_c0_seq1.p1 gnl/TRDRNA2_/TRDRNA2_190147_c0~~gnl/TRDRNA2_/TRDRNA2_190147_c0_seq1.p1  ORF type:complete len:439 (+),score=66.08 gnl/TRDRNA2_/TRDRNA2_190147_c0_seq1:47-1318(+)